jgi:hypothetical protein
MATRKRITRSALLKSNEISKLWNQLNDALKYAPKLQNNDRPGVHEETIQRIESKLGITLPKEIRDVVKVHDGRDHIGYGFGHCLATADLLPIAKWRPYEKQGDECNDLLFKCLVNENDRCANKNLCDDAQAHLAVYIDGIKKAEGQPKRKKRKTEYEADNDDAFLALPCELLIIGEGLDDYVQQYILSIRSGRIYFVDHAVPEWKLIGTFVNWIKMGIDNATKDREEIEEEYDNIEE